VLGLLVGCGRVGVKLLPFEADPTGDSGDGEQPSTEEQDGDLPDAGSEEADAGAGALDTSDGASASDASSADAASDVQRDGCSSADGSCALCNPNSYVADATCGVGYCRTTNTPSRCSGGVEQMCVPGAPRASSDTTADGVDDDCDGQIDEDTCTPRTDSYRAGTHSFSPPANCTTVRVRIWGGGGAAGDAQAGYWLNVSGGNGGAGGYAEQTFNGVATAITLQVGGGGRSCTAAGVGAVAAHNGGAGGSARAEAGQAGAAPAAQVGGSGGNASDGGDGGRGAYGGGGGGAGTDPAFAPHGTGGSGGAASVLTIDGVTLVAGGGGGGGGAGSNLATAGFAGGDGGAGCSGDGLASTNEGGGGGGGGLCQGAIMQAGSGRNPFDPGGGLLPADVARGGSNANDCAAGSEGYAIVSYSR
jgi:hypothetical protein